MGIDLVLAVVFAVLVGAIALDRHWAAGETAAHPQAAPAATSAQAPAQVPVTAPPVMALPVPDFADVAGRSEGWALLGPTGTVVATNLPERAALLAGACAVLRLAQGPDQGSGLDWRTVTLEGPKGVLLGEASPSGAVLAVLARREADSGALRRAMGQALAEVDRRWAALPQSAAPLPQEAAAAQAEPAAPAAFTPLD